MLTTEELFSKYNKNILDLHKAIIPFVVHIQLMKSNIDDPELIALSVPTIAHYEHLLKVYEETMK